MERIARIRVTVPYAGFITTSGQTIQNGEYSVDDPRLHGQAEFMVNTGRAIVTASYAEPALPEPVQAALEAAKAAAANTPPPPPEDDDPDEPESLLEALQKPLDPDALEAVVNDLVVEEQPADEVMASKSKKK